MYPDISQAIELFRQNQMMSGQQPIPEMGGLDSMQYLGMLAGSNPDLAGQFASSIGLDLQTVMQNAQAAGQYTNTPSNSLLGRAFGAVGDIGNFIQENPALLFAAPLGLAAAGGYFGAGGAAAGGGGAAAGGGAGGAASTFPYVAGGPVTVSAIPGITAGTTAAGAAAAAGGAGGMLDSSGVPIPGMEAAPGGGGLGGLLGNLFGGGMGGNWPSLIGGLLGALDANNQPNSMTTNQGGTSSSTYGQQLPSEITGPASEALASLRSLFQTGTPVAGVDPMTTAAMSRLQNLGSNPFASGGMGNTAPTASAFANGGMANNAPTTSMFAGGQTINPYLDQVFNTAADSTQSRLASEFAHAGTGAINSPSHQQARSQELQNLAAGIYAPGFESERNRQYGAAESGVDRLLAQMEGNLGRQYGAQESALSRLLAQTEGNLGRQYGATESNLGRELSSIYPMLAGGEYLRGVQQQQYDAPQQDLMRYLAGIQGLLPMFPGTQTQNTTQTGSVTNPLFNNPLAGFLGGAQLGSLFGG